MTRAVLTSRTDDPARHDSRTRQDAAKGGTGN